MASKPPKTYQDLKKRNRAFVVAVEALGNTVKEANPLDEKTAQLIQLAAAAAIRSEGSVHSHVRRAIEPTQIKVQGSKFTVAGFRCSG